MLGAELLCQLVELSLCGVDLFLQQAGPVLKSLLISRIACPSLYMAFRTTTELAGRFQRKTK